MVAGKVLEVTKHPDADKLSLVDIDFGAAQTRVVCGAPNVGRGHGRAVHAGAAPRSPAASRSNAARSAASSLRRHAAVGARARARRRPLGDRRASTPRASSAATSATILGLDDVIFDLSITPNRPDAMCIVGVARELAAHFKLPLDVPEPNASTDDRGRQRHLRGDRGARPLSPVPRSRGAGHDGGVARVDGAATREGGHAADQQRRRRHQLRAARAQPAAAHVRPRPARWPRHRRPARGRRRAHHHPRRRRARAHRRRSPHLRRRRARRRPSPGSWAAPPPRSATPPPRSCSSRRTSSRMGIAKTSKRLKLRSESSARFERGIDPDAVARNAERAMELLVDVAGARVAPDESRTCTRRRSSASASACARAGSTTCSGPTLDAEEVWDALAPLGIDLDQADASASDGDTLVATVPTFRPDLEREIDLVEEVARRVGFDHIGRTVPKATGQVGGLTPAPARSPRGGRRARGVRVLRGDHAVPGLTRRPRAGRRARRPPRARLESAPRRGVGAAHPRCSPGSCSRSRSTARTACTTSRSSSRATCSSLRLPARARCPTNPSTSRWRWRARCAAGRSRPTARSTSTTRSTRSAPWSTRSEIADVRARAGRHRRLPARSQRAGARRRRRRGRRSARWPTRS